MANNLNDLELTLYIDGRRRTTSGYDAGDVPLPGFMYVRSNTPSRMSVYRTEAQIQHFNNLTLHLSCAFDDLAAGYEAEDDDEVDTINDGSSTAATIGSDDPNHTCATPISIIPANQSHIFTDKLVATTALISHIPNLEHLTFLLDPSDRTLIDHLTREAVTVAWPSHQVIRQAAHELVELFGVLHSSMLHGALRRVEVKSSVETGRTSPAVLNVVRLFADAAREVGIREDQVIEAVEDEEQGRVLWRIMA